MAHRVGHCFSLWFLHLGLGLAPCGPYYPNGQYWTEGGRDLPPRNSLYYLIPGLSLDYQISSLNDPKKCLYLFSQFGRVKNEAKMWLRGLIPKLRYDQDPPGTQVSQDSVFLMWQPEPTVLEEDVTYGQGVAGEPRALGMWLDGG